MARKKSEVYVFSHTGPADGHREGQLIDQLTRAFRDLSDIASPELEAEIRKGMP